MSSSNGSNSPNGAGDGHPGPSTKQRRKTLKPDEATGVAPGSQKDFYHHVSGAGDGQPLETYTKAPALKMGGVLPGAEAEPILIYAEGPEFQNNNQGISLKEISPEWAEKLQALNRTIIAILKSVDRDSVEVDVGRTHLHRGRNVVLAWDTKRSSMVSPVLDQHHPGEPTRGHQDEDKDGMLMYLAVKVKDSVARDSSEAAQAREVFEKVDFIPEARKLPTQAQPKVRDTTRLVRKESMKKGPYVNGADSSSNNGQKLRARRPAGKSGGASAATTSKRKPDQGSSSGTDEDYEEGAVEDDEEAVAESPDHISSTRENGYQKKTVRWRKEVPDSSVQAKGDRSSEAGSTHRQQSKGVKAAEGSVKDEVKSGLRRQKGHRGQILTYPEVNRDEGQEDDDDDVSDSEEEEEESEEDEEEEEEEEDEEEEEESEEEEEEEEETAEEGQDEYGSGDGLVEGYGRFDLTDDQYHYGPENGVGTRSRKVKSQGQGDQKGPSSDRGRRYHRSSSRPLETLGQAGQDERHIYMKNGDTPEIRHREKLLKKRRKEIKSRRKRLVHQTELGGIRDTGGGASGEPGDQRIQQRRHGSRPRAGDRGQQQQHLGLRRTRSLDSKMASRSRGSYSATSESDVDDDDEDDEEYAFYAREGDGRHDTCFLPFTGYSPDFYDGPVGFLTSKLPDGSSTADHDIIVFRQMQREQFRRELFEPTPGGAAGGLGDSSRGAAATTTTTRPKTCPKDLGSESYGKLRSSSLASDKDLPANSDEVDLDDPKRWLWRAKQLPNRIRRLRSRHAPPSGSYSKLWFVASNRWSFNSRCLNSARFDRTDLDENSRQYYYYRSLPRIHSTATSSSSAAAAATSLVASTPIDVMPTSIFLGEQEPPSTPPAKRAAAERQKFREQMLL